jgi:hypothetical protein
MQKFTKISLLSLFLTTACLTSFSQNLHASNTPAEDFFEGFEGTEPTPPTSPTTNSSKFASTNAEDDDILKAFEDMQLEETPSPRTVGSALTQANAGPKPLNQKSLKEKLAAFKEEDNEDDDFDVMFSTKSSKTEKKTATLTSTALQPKAQRSVQETLAAYRDNEDEDDGFEQMFSEKLDRDKKKTTKLSASVATTVFAEGETLKEDSEDEWDIDPSMEEPTKFTANTLMERFLQASKRRQQLEDERDVDLEKQGMTLSPEEAEQFRDIKQASEGLSILQRCIKTAKDTAKDSFDRKIAARQAVMIYRIGSSESAKNITKSFKWAKRLDQMGDPFGPMQLALYHTLGQVPAVYQQEEANQDVSQYSARALQLILSSPTSYEEDQFLINLMKEVALTSNVFFDLLGQHVVAKFLADIHKSATEKRIAKK